MKTTLHPTRSFWGTVLAFVGPLALMIGLVAAPTARADGPANSAQTSRFEVDFLTGMVDHHHMAVMMAESCQEKAVHAELRAMCESIATTQSAEIEQMQTWLMDWYGVDHDPMMTGGGMRAMMRLDRLAGERFEVAFIKMMIRHHKAAIREAGRCLDRAEHGQVLALCASIRQDQRAEVATLQQWLSSWYHRALGRH